MAIYKEDIVDIELTTGTIYRTFLKKSIGEGDKLANRFGIRALRNGAEESLGGSCTGYFIRSTGDTVVIEGTVSGARAYVDLPQACYAYEGQFALAIKVTSGGATGTMRIVDGVVSNTATGSVIDPGTIIPSIDDLIDAIENAVASIPADYSSLWTSLAPVYSTSDTYAVGAYVTYDGKLYKCKTAITSAETWDSTHWTATDLDDAIRGITGSRVPRFVNFSDGSKGALTVSYNSSTNTYTITKNHEFLITGSFDNVSGLIAVGDTDSGFTMPDSFSGVITGNNFGYVCFDRNDRTTSSWQIVSGTGFRNNKNLCPIAVLYHDRAFFYDDNMKTLFTNSFYYTEFLNYEKELTSGIALYDAKLCNATALIRGTANLLWSDKKVVFTNPIFAPSGYVGGIDSFNGQTIEVDWSEQENPTYERCIYYDIESETFEAIYSGNLTAAERLALRARKAKMALICIVYQGTFVYTCGSCVPGKWFVNGKDLYGGASNEFPADLFKAFKRVGAVGDSMSVGYSYNKQTGEATSRKLEYSWPKKCQVDAGVPWLNLGTSGQNVLTWCTNATYGKVQAEASGNKCQAYIIGLGENDQSDSTRGIPLGTPSDIVDNYQTVATTYYGGYARIIQILRHINPDCKIFCLTNPRTGGNRETYNEAVRYISGTYYGTENNVFLVDLYNSFGMEFNGNSYIPTDHDAITSHYSAAGYARIASVIERAISDTIEANAALFIDIAFIAHDTGDPTPDTMQ